MADTIASTLDMDAACVISDLILHPDPDFPYDRMKERIINAFSSSNETKLRQLLKGQVGFEGKPTHFVAHLRRLNGGMCNDAVLKSILFEQLPETCRGILAASKSEDLQELAELADVIIEQLQPNQTTVATLQKSAPARDALSVQSQIDQITKDLADLKVLLNKKYSRSRSRSRTPSRIAKQGSTPRSRDKSGLCWRHKRFGASAHKCEQPCSWPTSPKAEN